MGTLTRQQTWTEKSQAYSDWVKNKSQWALQEWLGVQYKEDKTEEEKVRDMAMRWKSKSLGSDRAASNEPTASGVGDGGSGSGGGGMASSGSSGNLSRSGSRGTLSRQGSIGRRLGAVVTSANDDFEYAHQWASSPSIFIPKTPRMDPSSRTSVARMAAEGLNLNDAYELEIAAIYDETTFDTDPMDGQLHSPMIHRAAQGGRKQPPPPKDPLMAPPRRPIFIYTATIVQVILMFVAVRDGLAPMSENPWLGPTVEVLLDMGAKYGPYMHKKRHRFFTAIFLHVGFIHLLMNMLFQMSIGKELEYAYGWIRIGFIYVIAGLGGNLVSCLFVPDMVQVGASGALYGLLACIVIDLLQNWKLLRHIGQNPWGILFKQFLVILVSLGTGLFPGIDNFAHSGGFIFGGLAGIVFLPTINFGKWSAVWKLVLAVSAAIGIIVMFSVGMRMFDAEVKGEEWCSWCLEANCLSAVFNCDDFSPDPYISDYTFSSVV